MHTSLFCVGAVANRTCTVCILQGNFIIALSDILASCAAEQGSQEWTEARLQNCVQFYSKISDVP